MINIPYITEQGRLDYPSSKEELTNKATAATCDKWVQQHSGEEEEEGIVWACHRDGDDARFHRE